MSNFMEDLANESEDKFKEMIEFVISCLNEQNDSASLAFISHEFF